MIEEPLSVWTRERFNELKHKNRTQHSLSRIMGLVGWMLEEELEDLALSRSLYSWKEIHKYLFVDWMVCRLGRRGDRRERWAQVRMFLFHSWIESLRFDRNRRYVCTYHLGSTHKRRKTNKKQSHGSFRIFYANAQFPRKLDRSAQVECLKNRKWKKIVVFTSQMNYTRFLMEIEKKQH